MNTPMENREEDFQKKHLMMCGTCKYKKKFCTNLGSECYDEIVDDNCSCDEYVPQKGLRII